MTISRIRLLRLSLIYGEQDRDAMAQCWPETTKESKEAATLARRFRELLSDIDSGKVSVEIRVKRSTR